MINSVKEPYAWVYEEFDNNNQLLKSYTTPFKPSEISFKDEIKSKLHNIVLTPLFRCDDKAEIYTAVKKYDSKLLTEANAGL